MLRFLFCKILPDIFNNINYYFYSTMTKSVVKLLLFKAKSAIIIMYNYKHFMLAILGGINYAKEQQ